MQNKMMVRKLTFLEKNEMNQALFSNIKSKFVTEF